MPHPDADPLDRAIGDALDAVIAARGRLRRARRPEARTASNDARKPEDLAGIEAGLDRAIASLRATRVNLVAAASAATVSART